MYRTIEQCGLGGSIENGREVGLRCFSNDFLGLMVDFQNSTVSATADAHDIDLMNHAAQVGGVFVSHVLSGLSGGNRI